MLPYTRETRIPCRLGDRNYFAYKRLTGTGIRVELASPADLGLGIILPINFSRAPVYAWNTHCPQTCG